MELFFAILIVVIWFKTKEHKPECESPIEWRLYNALKNKGYDVRTQTRCGPYRVDLTLPKYRIAIECDGKAYHSSPKQREQDKRRSGYLYRNGYTSVLRFTGSEINRNPYYCVDAIERKINGRNR